MGRKLVLAMILAIVLVGMLTLAFDIQPVEASGTIYIGSDYTFTSNIYEPIVVTADNIIIDGNGYTLQGTGSGMGIDLTGRSNVTIKNVTIKGFYEGILLSSYSSSNSISGNNITNNEFGIYFDSSSNNTISGNGITTNNYTGISLEGPSSNNTISGNNITNNWEGLLLIFSSDNSIYGNNITENNDDGIWLRDSSNNNSIYGNNITANDWAGIDLWDSSNNTIHGNNVTATEWDGMRISGSYNTISGNMITNNGDGMSLSGYSHIISGNTITNNSDGIWLQTSSANTIYGNNITNSDYHGIELHNSSNNTIHGNGMTNNGDGIHLWDSSNNNSISGNTITNNNVGIYLVVSSNNSVYHNNFVNNTHQVDVDNSVNVWDNGVEGNYWSNYPDVDLNHDGIGDSPHVIGANNTDNFPLMGMFHSFNTPLGYNVNVISNSTIENFQYFESNSTIRMYVSNMTLNQIFGFCRVGIPKGLMSPPYTVIIDDGLTEVHYFNGTIYDNGTHRWIYFAYEHSTNEVDIIPEFPTWTSMLLILIMLTVAIAIIKRRLLKTPIH